MKNLKFSVPGQMLLMIKSHLSTAFLFMLFYISTFSMNGSQVYQVIFGTCGTLGYFLTIYSAASSAYFDDSKTISPLTPKSTKGFILPLMLTAFSLIVVLLYKLAWTYGATSQTTVALWAVPLNILALLWTMPYQPFLSMAGGNFSIVGYLIIFVTPFIASALGYFAAYKGFDLSEKVRSFAYEKKENKNKKEF